MLKAIGSFFRFLEGVALFALFIWFIGWYIKMHFNPRWFWLFWFMTIVACIKMYEFHHRPLSEIDMMTGQEFWEKHRQEVELDKQKYGY